MDELQKMLDTLKASVVGIATSDASNRAELLDQTFSEFGAALEPELNKLFEDSAEFGAEQLAKSAPDGTFDEPLFKGLGCVGRVADLVSMLARQVKTIKDGATPYQSESEDKDPASEEVADLLDHAVALTELALRAAVNEHVDVAMDGDEDDEHLNFVKLANAEDPDNEDAGILVKSYLPPELLQLAVDPGLLDMQIVNAGTALMLEGGVDESALVKVFELEDVELLNKDGDVMPGAGEDPNAGAGADDGSADANDPIAQLEIAGRIMAAGMMQIEHCMQLLEGGSVGAVDPNGIDPNADAGGDVGGDEGGDAPPGGGDEGGDAGTPPPADEGGDEGGDAGGPPDDKKKVEKLADGAEGGEELAKAQRELDDLRKQRDELAKHGRDAVAMIEQLSKQAAPPKGAVRAPALTKAQDLGGSEGDDQLSKLAGEYRRAPTEEAKRQVLLKASFKGIKGTDILAKAG